MKKLPVLFTLVLAFVAYNFTNSNQSLLPIFNPSSNNLAAFTQLDLVANIETIGVAVTGVNLPATAELMYRQTSDATWHSAHRLMRIVDGRLAGSLFGLSPATSYNIKVLDGASEIIGSIATQPNDLSFTPLAILHVNASAPTGGDGSALAPFKTIQDGVNHAVPGTQVLVADGIYHEAVTFPTSGIASHWIQVKAEGAGAILDGSASLAASAWKSHATRAHVWFTSAGPSFAYLARDGKRFYNYDNLSGLYNSSGHNGVTMNEGWYFETRTSKLYVRSLDDPSQHTWQAPRLNHAFEVTGRDWIWIEGFEMRFYGVRTDGCGVCTVNASHVVIRKNKIHNLQLGIYILWNGTDHQGNDTRIEYNEIYDLPVNEWPWKAVKGSTMEGTAIVVRGHIGAIVRGNELHNFNNGIYTGASGSRAEEGALAFDVDVYNNHIHHISDDALEPEGACINHRFRSNIVDTTFVGISLAPITQGPTWVLRSLFTNYTGRGVKWDGNPDGIVLIYHNTSWTNASNVNAMDMISPIHNVITRNNIFQSSGYGIYAVPTGSTGNDWNYDNWYTTRAIPHFKWENIFYNTLAQLCAATGLECNGHDNPPGLTNPGGGDFTLLAASPNVDRGVVIPGLNDNFAGSAPDIGAYEFGFDYPPEVASSVRANPNPTNAAGVKFSVTFSEPVTGVNVVDFNLVASAGITGASITSVTPVSGKIYTINVNTGSGDGSMRLDILDDDSITDAAGKPLGGLGAGNGNFTTGEAYTVVKSTLSASFRSNGANDGWALESSETSGQGGSMNSIDATFYLGDNAQNRQFRAILHFVTSALPDNAVIVTATLKIKKLSVTGTDPFTTHQNILADIRNGPFGVNALQWTDFQAAASRNGVATILNTPASGWYSAGLVSAAFPYINRSGVTQFRLRFQLDDNDDLGADTIKFYSGNYTALAYRPILQIEYYVP